MMAAYASSKFAVRGLAAVGRPNVCEVTCLICTQTAAAELGSQGIRVNVVAPGRKLPPRLLASQLSNVVFSYRNTCKG